MALTMWIWNYSRFAQAGALTVLLALPGCSVFLPYELASYKETVETVKSEPVDEADILLAPHSDGLGWTAQVRVTDRLSQQVTIEEIWKGKRVQACMAPALVGQIGFLCPVGLLLGVAANPFIADPVLPSSDRGFEFCMGSPTHPGLKTEVHDSHTLPGRITEQRRIAVKGTLQIRWLQPGKDAIAVEVPLSDATAGTVLRLSWLTDAMERNGVTLDHTLQGEGRIAFHDHPYHGMSSYPLTPDMLRAARQQALWRAPQAAWPTISVVSLSLDSGPQPGPALTIPIAELRQRLLDRHIAMVVRDDELTQLISMQRQQLLPIYQDTAVSPGHLTPATIVIRLRTRRTAQEAHVTATVLAVRSGQIIGTLHLEDQPNQSERLMRSLAALLPDLISPDPDRREGWFIQ